MVEEVLAVRRRMRLPGVDLLAGWEYRDTGCEVSPSCLACPLPVCKHDVAGGLAAVRRMARDAEIVALHKAGTCIGEIARRYGVSRRSIFRVLATADAE